MVQNPLSHPPTPARGVALFTKLVLASLRGSTYNSKYASPLRSLRPCWTRFLTILLFVPLSLLLSTFIISPTRAAESQLKAAPQKTGTEVTLMSVYFRDANLGWAVGSGGTVVKTVDGGQKWKKQTSGTSVQLTGVFFVDDKQGWIIGANGTIRHTMDGGSSWRAQPIETVAPMYGLSFVSPYQGWVG